MPLTALSGRTRRRNCRKSTCSSAPAKSRASPKSCASMRRTPPGGNTSAFRVTLRSRHATFTIDAFLHRLSKGIGGVRSQMRLLHHSANARPAPQPLDRFDGQRNIANSPKRRQRDQSDRSGSHRLRQRPKRRHHPRSVCLQNGASTRDRVDSASYTLILTFSIYRSSKLIRDSDKICKYIDIPFQHISKSVLQRMRRGKSGSAVREAVRKLRQSIPGLTLRTSLIVGFPGESEADFAELLEFVEEDRIRETRCIQVFRGRRHRRGAHARRRFRNKIKNGVGRK